MRREPRVTAAAVGMVIGCATSGRGLPVEERTVDSVFAALNAHDASALVALYAPDAIVAGVGPKGWEETRGRAPIEADHRALFANLPDVSFAPARVLAGIGVAVVEWTTTGTGRGRRRGFRAATVYTLNGDGLITSDHTFFDAQARPAPETLPSAAPSVIALRTTGDGAPEGRSPAATLRRLYAARSARRDGDVLSLLAEDVVASSLYEPADLVGRGAVARALAESAKALAALSVEPTHVWTFGSIAAAEVIVRATFADGRQAVMHACDVAEVRDGTIVRVTSYGAVREMMARGE
jgi:ketosteroid isomerase-like protein